MFSSSQFVGSGRVHSFLRLDPTLFASVRRLNEHGAHMLWPASRSSIRAPSGFRCGGKGNMSTRRFFGARTRRNGRSKSNGASIGASRRSQGAPGTPSPLATWFAAIERTSTRSATPSDDRRRQASLSRYGSSSGRSAQSLAIDFFSPSPIRRPAGSRGTPHL